MATEIQLKTSRLLLKPLNQSSVEEIFSMHSDAEVMKFIGPPSGLDEAKSFFEKYVKMYAPGSGMGIFPAYLMENDVFIGWFLLKPLSNNPENQVEIGWRLKKEYWGNGFATEGAKELLQHAFANLKLEKIISVTVPENLASIAVMKKIGMDYVKNMMHANLDHVLYEIRRA